MLQSRQFSFPFYKAKKELQYIIRINFFESNKNFASAVSMSNKLLVDMHKFLDIYCIFIEKSVLHHFIQNSPCE